MTRENVDDLLVCARSSRSRTVWNCEGGKLSCGVAQREDVTEKMVRLGNRGETNDIEIGEAHSKIRISILIIIYSFDYDKNKSLQY